MFNIRQEEKKKLVLYWNRERYRAEIFRVLAYEFSDLQMGFFERSNKNEMDQCMFFEWKKKMCIGILYSSKIYEMSRERLPIRIGKNGTCQSLKL